MAFHVRIHSYGGPEVLKYEEVELAAPGAGEILVRNRACGVNFVDTYFRTGLYRGKPLPLTLGNEAAGIVEAVGPGVTEWKTGDRVAYSYDLGGYATQRLIPADRVVRIPDGVSDELAAAVMLKGCTAYFLLHETYELKAGDTILVHAAAGGVGTLLCQWASKLGATVIGTVGSREKVALAKANGCKDVILYQEEDFAERVRAITNGKLCHAVFDGIGKTTYPASLDCLRPRGVLVCFGNASGPIECLEVNALARKGSLYVTRPTGAHYLADRESLNTAASAVFAAVNAGTLRVKIDRMYPLSDAAIAHRDLESRATTGSQILLPE